MEFYLMLHEYQSSFKAAVLEKQPEIMNEFLSGPSQVNRMSIYRNNIFVSLMNVLYAAFPKTSALVGANNFQVLAKKFVETNPPNQAQLSEYGADFPEFLANWDQIMSDIPYLSDLAHMDWACQKAYFAKSYQPIDASIFASMTPEELFETKLMVGASVVLLKCGFPVHHFSEMETIEIEQLSPEAEYIMVYRVGDTEEILTDLLTEDEFLFLENLKTGMSLGEAFLEVADGNPLFDLQASLTQFLHKSVFMSLGE